MDLETSKGMFAFRNSNDPSLKKSDVCKQILVVRDDYFSVLRPNLLMVKCSTHALKSNGLSFDQ